MTNIFVLVCFGFIGLGFCGALYIAWFTLFVLYPNRNSAPFRVRRWKLLLIIFVWQGLQILTRPLLSLLRLELLINNGTYRALGSITVFFASLFTVIRMFFLWFDLHYNRLQESQLISKYLFNNMYTIKKKMKNTNISQISFKNNGICSCCAYLFIHNRFFGNSLKFTTFIAMLMSIFLCIAIVLAIKSHESTLFARILQLVAVIVMACYLYCIITVWRNPKSVTVDLVTADGPHHKIHNNNIKYGKQRNHNNNNKEQEGQATTNTNTNGNTNEKFESKNTSKTEITTTETTTADAEFEIEESNNDNDDNDDDDDNSDNNNNNNNNNNEKTIYALNRGFKDSFNLRYELTVLFIVVLIQVSLLLILNVMFAKDSIDTISGKFFVTGQAGVAMLQLIMIAVSALIPMKTMNNLKKQRKIAMEAKRARSSVSGKFNFETVGNLNIGSGSQTPRIPSGGNATPTGLDVSIYRAIGLRDILAHETGKGLYFELTFRLW